MGLQEFTSLNFIPLFQAMGPSNLYNKASALCFVHYFLRSVESCEKEFQLQRT